MTHRIEAAASRSDPSSGAWADRRAGTRSQVRENMDLFPPQRRGQMAAPSEQDPDIPATTRPPWQPSDPPIPPQMQHAMRTLVLDRATAEIVVAWRGAGVRSVLLKGPAITRWLYRENEIRGYADIDLLVPDQEVEAAEEVLKALGFERHGLETIEGDWPRYSRNWVRSDSVDVDLHQTLAGVGVPPATLWTTLTEGLEQMTVAGVDVDVLAPPARALALALHTAKDGSRIAKARHDLGHAIDRLPRRVVDRDRAARGAAGGAGQLGRRSPSRRPLGGGVGRSARTPGRSPFGHRHPLEGGAPALALRHRLARFESWRPRQRSARTSEDLPARLLHARVVSARQRGRLGLVAAYAYRPLWVLWHAGPALWALARARKSGGTRVR